MAKTKFAQFLNYPRPADFYLHDHSPAQHFALAGYECLASRMNAAGHPSDDELDEDPEAKRRFFDAYVLRKLMAIEAPKKKADPDKVQLCGVPITWHIELPRLKVWAGQMSLHTIIAPRVLALAEYDIAKESLFDFRVAMRSKPDLPIGASGLDPRAIVSARDAGFSLTELGMAIAQHPAVDLLAIIGMQVSPITRIGWAEYGYAGAPNPWDTQDAWHFKIETREGGYLRNFGYASKWRTKELTLPEPGTIALREHVIALAEKKKMTAYAIAKETRRGDESAVSEDHVQRYLQGTHDMTSERLDAVLAVLGGN